MQTLFISDLHLNENNLLSYNLFIKFLNSITTKTAALYILGDLFEFWVDDNLNTPFLDHIKTLLKNTTSKCPIYIIRGNRDFLLSDKFAKETGTTILPDLFTLNLYGNKTLLMHGDFLCSHEKIYVCIAKIARHPMIISLLNRIPIGLKLKIAKILRNISIKRHENSLKKLYQHKKIINSDVNETTVKKLMLQHKCTILIHGHTHKPNIHNIKFKTVDSSSQLNLTRIVLGDWHNEAQILEYTSTGYNLKKISI